MAQPQTALAHVQLKLQQCTNSKLKHKPLRMKAAGGRAKNRGLPWLLKVCWQSYPINQSAQADWLQQKQAWLPEVSKAGVLVEAVLPYELAIISGQLKCVCMLLHGAMNTVLTLVLTACVYNCDNLPADRWIHSPMLQCTALCRSP